MSAEPTRYDGPIAELRELLASEAKTHRGKWAWRLVRRGTLVAFRVDRADHATLRIARDSAPLTLYEQARWEAEVRELTAQLGARRWHRQDDERDGDAVAALFAEPSSDVP